MEENYIDLGEGSEKQWSGALGPLPKDLSLKGRSPSGDLRQGSATMDGEEHPDVAALHCA